MLITRAAIMFQNGEVVEGHDYGSIMTMAHKLSFSGDKIYGFVTGAGEFVTPTEASEIALKAGQITDPINELKPDDLWPNWGNE